MTYWGKSFFQEVVMGRRHVFMELSAEEAAQLREFIKNADNHRARTRAQAIWFSSRGQTVQQISSLLSVTERVVWKWFDAYSERGLEGLKRKPYPKRETILNPQREEDLVAITRQAPNTVGMRGYTWNCRLLKDWLDKTYHVKLSQEWVRRILRRHGLRFRRPKLKLTSPDPNYAQKKMPLTS